jgi:hypothetical protein
LTADLLLINWFNFFPYINIFLLLNSKKQLFFKTKFVRGEFFLICFFSLLLIGKAMSQPQWEGLSFYLLFVFQFHFELASCSRSVGWWICQSLW